MRDYSMGEVDSGLFPASYLLRSFRAGRFLSGLKAGVSAPWWQEALLTPLTIKMKIKIEPK